LACFCRVPTLRRRRGEEEEEEEEEKFIHNF
jgi:hypothetical protein